ncbi:MAG: ISKra4 family transposase, partial [Gammaproteobacteria bacterium]|nr:ISKra4 family transposase [Gammaproteobacteria bacterium]
CRHLINDRMDITGARWGLKTAEAVLKLRSLRSSGDFEQYWEYHKQRELERNHLVKYQGQKLPKVA